MTTGHFIGLIMTFWLQQRVLFSSIFASEQYVRIFNVKKKSTEKSYIEKGFALFNCQKLVAKVTFGSRAHKKLIATISSLCLFIPFKCAYFFMSHMALSKVFESGVAFDHSMGADTNFLCIWIKQFKHYINRFCQPIFRRSWHQLTQMIVVLLT